jgi:FdhD protein
VQEIISVTMRTPGEDRELAAGFLFTEGIITDPSHIMMITPDAAGPNTVLVIMKENIQPLLQKAGRNFYTTSSCGICGKASIEAIRLVSQYEKNMALYIIDASILYQLPDKMKQHQQLFERTGGIHACGLFTSRGDFISVFEDVGRHNALDKLIGDAFLKHLLPLSDCLLLLSGRASFEMVQKAHMAGIKFVAAVGAPSSLAVEFVRENDISLVGFLRGNRCNIYSGEQRIK